MSEPSGPAPAFFPTLLIGTGSPLMGDDGLGLAALERLRERWRFEPPVELMDGGTWGMNLLPFIEAAERVLILDAVDAGREAGELVMLEREALPCFFTTKLSPHQIDLREVLALAELRGTLPEDTVVIGLQPGRVEMATELGPRIRERVEELVSAAIGRLEAWGHRARRAEGTGLASGRAEAAPREMNEKARARAGGWSSCTR